MNTCSGLKPSQMDPWYVFISADNDCPAPVWGHCGLANIVKALTKLSDRSVLLALRGW